MTITKQRESKEDGTGEDESIVSQNRYCHIINNPYKYVDSNGEVTIEIILVFLAKYGAQLAILFFGC